MVGKLDFPLLGHGVVSDVRSPHVGCRRAGGRIVGGQGGRGGVVSRSRLWHRPHAVVGHLFVQKAQQVPDGDDRVEAHVLVVLPFLADVDVLGRFPDAGAFAAFPGVTVAREAFVFFAGSHFGFSCEPADGTLQRVLPLKSLRLRLSVGGCLLPVVGCELQLRFEERLQGRFKPTVDGQAAPTAFLLLAAAHGELRQVVALEVHLRLEGKASLGIGYHAALDGAALDAVVLVAVGTEVERESGIRLAPVVVLEHVAP